MDITISDICNNNNKNIPSDEVYSYFNKFIFSNDTKLLGKLLHRFDFFNQVKHFPVNSPQFKAAVRFLKSSGSTPQP